MIGCKRVGQAKTHEFCMEGICEPNGREENGGERDAEMAVGPFCSLGYRYDCAPRCYGFYQETWGLATNESIRSVWLMT